MRLLPLKSRFVTLFKSNQRGIVLPMILAYSAIFAIEAVGLSIYAGSSSLQIQSQTNRLKGFYLAEAAIEKAVAEIGQIGDKEGRPPTDVELADVQAHVPLVGDAFSVTSLVNYDGESVSQIITSGQFKGLQATTQDIRIQVTATPNERSGASVTQTQMVQVQNIPSFQFAMFYHKDLEMHTKSKMKVIGPVHSNRNIYIATDDKANIHLKSKVTAHKKILHGIKHQLTSGPALGGKIAIDNKEGMPVDMKINASEWLDSSSRGWKREARRRWGGQVRSRKHHVERLRLKLPSSVDGYRMIKQPKTNDTEEEKLQKLAYKAQIWIMDGVVTDDQGMPIELRYCMGGLDAQIMNDTCDDGSELKDPFSEGNFYSYREDQNIKTTDIDVETLNGSPFFVSTAQSNNGIAIYFYDSRNQATGDYQDGVRLINGSTLAYPMTVISRNPVFVKGDYNTVNKKPAGFISDAFTLQSDNFFDLQSFQDWGEHYGNELGYRLASPTTLHAAIMTGVTPTVRDSNASYVYGGGIMGGIRLMEDWEKNDITMTFKGAFVSIFDSRDANSEWKFENVFKDPERDWQFDTDYLDPNYVIPAFPTFYAVVRTKWSND
jgi:hypothetical protein